MKTSINEVIFCLWVLGKKCFVTGTHSTKQNQVYEAHRSARAWIARTHPRTHARTRTHAPSRPAHVKLIEEPLTGSGLAAAFTYPLRPRLTRHLSAGAHTWERTRGPSSSHCSTSLSVFEKNEQRGCLSIQNSFAFLPTPWLRSALRGST